MSLRSSYGINAGDPNRLTLADLLNIKIPDWYDQALCAQTDPEAFFPEKGGSTRAAKAICNGDPARGIDACPVREQCLQAALDNAEAHGLWGGVSERDRRRVLRDQRREIA